MAVVLVLSTTTFSFSSALRGDIEEPTEDANEWEEEVKDDRDTLEADEERDEGRESTFEPASESVSVSENETTWTVWAAEGTYIVSWIKEGGKTVVVGVGETTEMSHFERKVNISSASSSS